jgi:Domain of unknown function (DUF4198)
MRIVMARRVIDLQTWLAALTLWWGTASAVFAHEFWLDVVNYQPKVGDGVPVLHRTGQKFLGDSYPFLKAWSKRFVVIDARGERPIKAIEGDDPAAEVKFRVPGLAILAYQRTPDTLEFENFAKFESYLADEGLEAFGAQHRALKKPETKISELYMRCAKALVAVAGGAGSDRAVGLPLEIVAERNPYELPQGEPLPVRVLHDGKPLAGVMIKVFHLKDPEQPRRIRTGPDGRAEIPLPLAGEFLLNAVHMTAPPPREKADWLSLWASLTFIRP